jgi:hypothetical protein
MALRLTPVLLSFVLLAAHFSRHAVPFVPYLCLAIPLLLLVRKTWVPRLLQVLLAVGALEWLRTAFVLAGRRVDAGEPWIRMAVILGVVALLTAGSVALLQSDRVRQRYVDR